MKESIIQRIPLFASLPPRDIQYLAETLREIELAPGTIVFREGEHGGSLYLVLRGEIEIYKSMGTEDERVFAAGGPGSYFGEMSLFDREGQRTASVRTRTAATLLEMTGADFDVLLHRQPALTYELIRELSKHLDEAHNATIRDLREKNNALSQAYEELKTAQAQLIEKERLEQELAVARQIQESILPSELPKVPGFDLGARLTPSRAVGGDLFDLMSLDGGNLGVAVGDVSDKGVPAAIFMALTRSLLHAEASRSSSPRTVLQNVNRVLLEMNDAGMFVTVLYGILNTATREFHYVRAGHELPLVVDAQGELAPVQSSLGQPLGLFDEVALDEENLRLGLGSLLIVNTDGVTDQQDEQGTLFGAERLRQAARANREGTAQSICDRLMDAVNTFRGAAPQSDDITFVVVRVE